MARTGFVLCCVVLCAGVALSKPAFDLRDELVNAIEEAEKRELLDEIQEMKVRKSLEERDYCVGNPCPTGQYCYAGMFINGLLTSFCSTSSNPCDNVVSACGNAAAQCINYGLGNYLCKVSK
ncbi:uncharacterized protein [Antedon mediterranea]|uniref:uncharacterized protein n=1 Tax=Antedon mediterranea TaxID=105859 RepID=UPI003AF81045